MTFMTIGLYYLVLEVKQISFDMDLISLLGKRNKKTVLSWFLTELPYGCRFADIKRAAKMLGRELTKTEVNLAIQSFLRDGKIKQAQLAGRYRNQDVSFCEISDAARYLSSKELPDITTALELILLLEDNLIKSVEIDRLVQTCLKRGLLEYCVEILEDLEIPVGDNVVYNVLMCLIKNGRHEEVFGFIQGERVWNKKFWLEFLLEREVHNMSSDLWSKVSNELIRLNAEDRAKGLKERRKKTKLSKTA